MKRDDVYRDAVLFFKLLFDKTFLRFIIIKLSWIISCISGPEHVGPCFVFRRTYLLNLNIYTHVTVLKIYDLPIKRKPCFLLYHGDQIKQCLITFQIFAENHSLHVN